ncbi:hypothetical protein PP357_gp44 [Arthrobacter phage Sarge]|uniref:Uncharacterized protein n=1 Tax=Arthrobacter phage Sarge TaxID=2885974 RepID=A0AAE9C2K4_9CAUD|nr:hypothetical protein PP357_gp44 [Arthrobacter phage Sarge]UDL14891.1 hypothetical protein SEA_SARGE_44 [Arthrobacter phage Sarge]
MTAASDRLEAIQARTAADRKEFTDGGYEPGSDVCLQDREYLLDLARKQQAALDALSDWAGRNRTGFYDEAQDDAVQIIREALEAKP